MRTIQIVTLVVVIVLIILMLCMIGLSSVGLASVAVASVGRPRSSRHFKEPVRVNSLDGTPLDLTSDGVHVVQMPPPKNALQFSIF